jgi:hypothetical protein
MNERKVYTTQHLPQKHLADKTTPTMLPKAALPAIGLGWIDLRFCRPGIAPLISRELYT